MTSSESTFGMSMPMFVLEPRDTAALRWAKYVDRFDNFLEAAGIEKPSRKKAMLLHHIGEDLYNVYQTLVVRDPVGDETVYDVTKEVLTGHFAPERNREFELFQFREASQGADEDLDSFYARLQQLARNCGFDATNRDSEIKSQIIQKCNMSKLRDEGLCNPKLSLQDILKLGRTQEASKLQAKIMMSKLHPESATGNASTVNKLTNTGTSTSGGTKSKRFKQKRAQDKTTPSDSSSDGKRGKKCYACGNKWPHPKNKPCPAIGKKCKNCGKANHFACVCRKTDKVYAMESVPEEYDEMFHITQVSGQNSKGAYQVQLGINGVQTQMEVDTGASLSIMSAETYQTFCHPKAKPVLKKSTAVLKTYTGETIFPEGEIDVTVSYGDQIKSLKLTILPGSGPSLLGRDWLKEIRFDWSNVNKLNKISSDEIQVNEFLQPFKDLFKDELGQLKGTSVKIHLEANAEPQFHKSRPIPFSMRNKVLSEIDRLEKDGIIKPVEFSDWAAPLVPVLKPSGDIRLCGDYKVTINRATKVDTYPIPRVEELFNKLTGGKIYSKLDLSNAYQQLTLDEDSQKLTTVNTPKGLYKYTRLPYGVSSAPGIFQRTLETLLQGIPKTAVYLDDILVAGATPVEHQNNLRQVLKKLQDSGLRLKKNKCMFFEKSVTYLGHLIDGQGIHPSSTKVQGILEAPTPKNVSELRSYLGMINYYNKFIPNASTVFKPLYDLLHSGVKWSWNKAQEKAFSESKRILMSSRVLVHYNPDKQLYLECDASPYGLGIVLSQEMDDGEQHPIAYASRMLAPAECKYAQIEKEGLSVIFGLKHFHRYLYGRKFFIVTDHKPLLGLFRENRPTPVMASARVQRWALLLGAYNYKLIHKPGHHHGNANALSRLPSSESVPSNIPEPPEVVFNFKHMDLGPITSQEVAQESRHDPVISRVIQYVLQGWPLKLNEVEMKPFFTRQNELTVQSDCLLWGSRIVIPKKLRRSVLDELHESHPGIVKMKLLSRSYVWWPCMDHDIETVVKQCSSCQIHANNPVAAPLHPWSYPSTPWQRIHIDYAGPVENKMILIIVDASSKFMDAHVMSGSSSSATIDRLRHTFAMQGLPREIVSDNGTPFTSEEFQNFCNSNGIRHIRVSPYHPSSNGLAERGVQSLKNGLKKLSGGSLESKVYRFLLTYNVTPHGTTGECPSVLLNKRRLRTRLDLIRPDLQAKVEFSQDRMKAQHDKHSKSRILEIGDTVYCRNFRGNPKWISGVITKQLGPVSFLVALPDGRVWKRHINHLRHHGLDGVAGPSHSSVNLPDRVNLPDSVQDAVQASEPLDIQDKAISQSVHNSDNQDNGDNGDIGENQSSVESVNAGSVSTPGPKSRPSRNRQRPQKYSDYVIYS